MRTPFLAVIGLVLASALPGADAAAQARSGMSAPRVAVLPPRRPAGLGRGADIVETGSIGPAATARSAPPLPIAPAAAGDKPAVSGRAAIERANAALNALASMTADFTQTNSDGRQLTGTLYLQRPGKLRFEYDKPSTLEIVSDGSTVLVRDRKLNTSDPYPISQTPLKFLLSSKIDLSREATVTGVATEPDGVRISIEDTTTLGGTSKIALVFDPDIAALKRWRVVDPQGYTTSVALSDIEKNRTIDPRIFMLNYSRPVE